MKNTILRKNDRPLDEVLQFPHVSGPRMRGQRVNELNRDRVNALVHRACKLGHKMLDQQWNVFESFPQRWNMNREDIQAIVKIAAKLPVLDHLREIPARSSHDADIYFSC